MPAPTAPSPATRAHLGGTQPSSHNAGAAGAVSSSSSARSSRLARPRRRQAVWFQFGADAPVACLVSCGHQYHQLALSLAQPMPDQDWSKEFSEAEAKLLRDLFDEFDEDKSGEVDVTELAKMVESLGMVVGKAQIDAWLKVRRSGRGARGGESLPLRWPAAPPGAHAASSSPAHARSPTAPGSGRLAERRDRLQRVPARDLQGEGGAPCTRA